jgi:fatty acid synthase subunit beta
MDRLPDLADITTRIHLSLNKKSELCRAIARDSAADFKGINGLEAERVFQTVNVTPRTNFRFDFPALESPESLAHLQGIMGESFPLLFVCGTNSAARRGLTICLPHLVW